MQFNYAQIGESQYSKVIGQMLQDAEFWSRLNAKTFCQHDQLLQA